MGSNISNSSSTSEASWRADALEALKLDPAVLEARIGVSSNKNNVEPIQEEEKDSFIEESVDETDGKGNDGSDCSGPSEFEKELTLQKAALFSLAPEQYHDLLNYVAVMRLEREINQKHQECGFCKKNGKPPTWYTSHRLKDSCGRVLCPVLRGLRCPVCGATGDNAHTFKYCPDVLLDMGSDCSGPSEFEKELTLQKAALFSLAPEQYHDLLNYVAVMRLEREINQKHQECGFCKKNGKPPTWYTSHRLKDSCGRVLCPVLRGLRCPVCGATGDNAHTFKYCPDVLLDMDR